MLLDYSWKLHFIKVVEVKWKVFQKQTFCLTYIIYQLLWCSTEKQIQLHKYQNKSTYFSYFFFKFSFFRFTCVNFFCILYFVIKLNCISCGIYLSFKRRHLELFCKIIIHLSTTGIFLELWSRGPPSYITKQLFFLQAVNGCFQSFN